MTQHRRGGSVNRWYLLRGVVTGLVFGTVFGALGGLFVGSVATGGLLTFLGGGVGGVVGAMLGLASGLVAGGLASAGIVMTERQAALGGAAVGAVGFGALAAVGSYAVLVRGGSGWRDVVALATLFLVMVVGAVVGWRTLIQVRRSFVVDAAWRIGAPAHGRTGYGMVIVDGLWLGTLTGVVGGFLVGTLFAPVVGSAVGAFIGMFAGACAGPLVAGVAALAAARLQRPAQVIASAVATCALACGFAAVVVLTMLTPLIDALASAGDYGTFVVPALLCAAVGAGAGFVLGRRLLARRLAVPTGFLREQSTVLG